METDDKEGLALSSTELADVLVNKKNSDKFSMDIVNDLESILCSPIRSKVSESSITGPDFIPQGLITAEVEVVDLDSDKPPSSLLPRGGGKWPRPTIIECRRQYLPSSSGEDRKKSVYKPYVAKIAASSSSGISSKKFSILGKEKSSYRTAVRSSISTTEDEVETLDDLIHSEWGVLPRKHAKREYHKCEICNKEMEDKFELMIHVKSHF